MAYDLLESKTVIFDVVDDQREQGESTGKL